MSINRQPMDASRIFASRGDKVKWPTIRGGYLTDESVERLVILAKTKGQSIIFLDGYYHTNLNRWAKKPSEERAVFFEYTVRHGTQMFFLLVWIGNFHNGSIFHCGYQFPHIKLWQDAHGQDWLELRAHRVYKYCVEAIYGDTQWDHEVREFAP